LSISLTSLSAGLRYLLPTGLTLPDSAWRPRHRAMVCILFAEAIGLAIFSALEGNGPLHSVGHAALLAVIGVAALLVEHRRRAAAVLVSFGLITACALLVHTWHGAIEGHFLFFVTIVILALYEDWVPFLLAAGYVVLHHGTMGAIDPGAVYNHPDAVAHPWKWAVIHAAFVTAAGVAAVAAWRLNETVRAQAQESYRRAAESEARFRGAFEEAPIGMVLFSSAPDHVGEVLQVNRAMAEITGYSREQLCSNGFRDVVHPDDAKAATRALERLLADDGKPAHFELRYIHAEGHTVWVDVTVSLLHAESGALGHAIAQVQDITERKLAAEELTYQALHDSLTELGNRRCLLADLERQLADASPEEPLVLLLFDLDGFKTYNDTFGHPAGDSLLTRLAARLKASLPREVFAYRVGGDEFCVLGKLPAGDPDALAIRAAEALSERGEDFYVTASYGSVLLPVEAATTAEAMRIADRRMYARKSLASRTSAGRQSADVLLRILSERSPALGVHLDEVTALCDAVAERLGVPEEDRAPLLQAASLHDAGKVAIPDEILHKPDVLDDDEWAYMRRHTLIGERILAAAPALTRAAKLVRSSHERFDGKGYPDGLTGAAIPLGARIIAVCDAYDAMISDRPYKERISPAEARAELRSCAGEQFDPQVVEVFCAVLRARELKSAGATGELSQIASRKLREAPAS
jgi:diguanylate cyclase (GGDEF)-like protein/PAS domain S-box-containing protein